MSEPITNATTLDALRALPTVPTSLLLRYLRPVHDAAPHPGETFTEHDVARVLRTAPPPPPLVKTRAQMRAVMAWRMAQHEVTWAIVTMLEWHALTVEELTTRLEQHGIDFARERAVAYEEARAVYRACRRQSVATAAQLLGIVLR